jgi:hypothetical protein
MEELGRYTPLVESHSATTAVNWSLLCWLATQENTHENQLALSFPESTMRKGETAYSQSLQTRSLYLWSPSELQQLEASYTSSVIRA